MASSRAIFAAIEREMLCRVSIEGARPRIFILGPRFEETLRKHDEGRQRKAIRACADVVIGAPGLLSARSDHPYRTGPASTALPVTRSDGAIARRCYVEKNVPSALRLHYWVLLSGGLELASVITHDKRDFPA